MVTPQSTRMISTCVHYASESPFLRAIIIDHNSSSRIDDDDDDALLCIGYDDRANNNLCMPSITRTHTRGKKETLKQGDVWKGDRVREQQRSSIMLLLFKAGQKQEQQQWIVIMAMSDAVKSYLSLKEQLCHFAVFCISIAYRHKSAQYPHDSWSNLHTTNLSRYLLTLCLAQVSRFFTPRYPPAAAAAVNACC